eukprot:EG_transcript_6648
MSLILASAPVDVALQVLQFCTWCERVQTSLINQHWCRKVFGTEVLWVFFGRRLEAEHYVYVPRVCVHTEWRLFFQSELWPLRSRWVATGPATLQCTSVSEFLERTRQGAEGLSVEPAWKGAPKPQQFNVSVVARFRPKGALRHAASTKPTVQLPLHQRLQLLRRQHRCSTGGAGQLLFGPCQRFFDDALVPEEAADEEEGRTAVRQPTEQLEKTEDATAPKHTLEDPLIAAGVVSVTAGQVVMCAPGVGLRAFTCFDGVHGERATQAMLYEGVGRRQVLEFLNGLNVTLICYGQTGSGKTFTLFGPDTATSCSLRLSAQSGIVPRACAEICTAIAHRQGRGIQCQLGVSYVEVFGEQVTDLLREGVAVGPWRGAAARAVLDGTARVSVSNETELEELLLVGEQAKRRAATLMNDRSSRAHTLLLLTLTQEVAGMSATCTLLVADLGGCEQLKKSGAQGERVQEAININTGLLALKRCIKALNEGARYVPYQDSKLTMFLRGDSKLTVVVTCSMDADHAGETMQALRFGEKCAVVKQDGQHRVSCVKELLLLEALDHEIAECREEIRLKERWVTTEVVRVDIEGGVERVTRSQMVGAEAEQGRLDELLQLRRQLTGVVTKVSKE